MDMYKVKILSKNESFLLDLYTFLIEKSNFLKRDLAINNILTDSCSLDKNIKYIQSLKSIELDDVYGSTYQSHIRTNDNIYSISHYLKSIQFENENIFGIVEPAPYGVIVDFDKGFLRPVYFRPTKEISLKIATFDIDFNITDSISHDTD